MFIIVGFFLGFSKIYFCYLPKNCFVMLFKLSLFYILKSYISLFWLFPINEDFWFELCFSLSDLFLSFFVQSMDSRNNISGPEVFLLSFSYKQFFFFSEVYFQIFLSSRPSLYLNRTTHFIYQEGMGSSPLQLTNSQQYRQA